MQQDEKEIFLVTGGSGYVGKLLLSKLISDDRVGKIIVIDKEDMVENLKNNSKIFFIQKNLANDFGSNWEKDVAEIENKNNFKITKVVHLAWQIRTMYGQEKLQNHWNIDGSQKVFEFVKNNSKENSGVKTFIHFSTVASYGALKENTFQTIFTEDKPFRKTNYLYAEEKRIVEENLDNLFGGSLDGGGVVDAAPAVYVIRPASITGPSGRERTSFGLQSALSGKIASQGFLFKLISKVLQFMPATHGWARQFVFEDDIVQAILVMSFSEKKPTQISKYNLCPKTLDNQPNYIDAKEMGEILNKKVIYLPPQLVRILCFLAWHLTLGKIPTSAGVWKAYSYPIIVDGTKIEKDFPEFRYQKTLRETFPKK